MRRKSTIRILAGIGAVAIILTALLPMISAF
jgi:hypothetical protein